MNNFIILLKFEGLQNLYRKSSDQSQTNSLEIVCLYELVQVHAQ